MAGTQALGELVLSVFTRVCLTLTSGIQPLHSDDLKDTMEHKIRGLMFPGRGQPSLHSPSKHHQIYDLVLDVLLSGAPPVDAVLADCVLVERWRLVFDPGAGTGENGRTGSTGSKKEHNYAYNISSSTGDSSGDGNSSTSCHSIPAFISRRCSIQLRSLYSLMLLLPARNMLQRVENEIRPHMSYRLYQHDTEGCGRDSRSGTGRKLSLPIRMTTHTHTHSHIDPSTSCNSSSADSSGFSANGSSGGSSGSIGISSKLGTCFGGATSTFEFPEIYPLGGPNTGGSSSSDANSGSGVLDQAPAVGCASIPAMLYIGSEFLASAALRCCLDLPLLATVPQHITGAARDTSTGSIGGESASVSASASASAITGAAARRAARGEELPARAGAAIISDSVMLCMGTAQDSASTSTMACDAIPAATTGTGAGSATSTSTRAGAGAASTASEHAVVYDVSNVLYCASHRYCISHARLLPLASHAAGTGLSLPPPPPPSPSLSSSPHDTHCTRSRSRSRSSSVDFPGSFGYGGSAGSIGCDTYHTPPAGTPIISSGGSYSGRSYHVLQLPPVSTFVPSPPMPHTQTQAHAQQGQGHGRGQGPVPVAALHTYPASISGAGAGASASASASASAIAGASCPTTDQQIQPAMRPATRRGTALGGLQGLAWRLHGRHLPPCTWARSAHATEPGYTTSAAAGGGGEAAAAAVFSAASDALAHMEEEIREQDEEAQGGGEGDTATQFVLDLSSCDTSTQPAPTSAPAAAQSTAPAAAPAPTPAFACHQEGQVTVQDALHEFSAFLASEQAG